MLTLNFPAPTVRRRLVPTDSAMRRVLVAVCLHSDDEGLACRASDDVLCDSASVSPRELADALRGLVESCWIESLVIPAGQVGAGRVIVLKDHEAAEWYLAETRAMIRAANFPVQ